MKTCDGKTITNLQAAKQIFFAFGMQATVGDWADCANEHSGIETWSASEQDQIATYALVYRVSERVAKCLRLRRSV